MSLEAVKIIREAEEQAQQMKAQAAERCKQQLAQARQEAEGIIAAARGKAAAEAEQIRQAEEEKLSAQLQEIVGNTQNKKATIRARAENRMDEAVSLIAGRIVNI